MTKSGGKMGKRKKSKSSGVRNSDRPNGKSWKKNPRKPRKTGRTVGGYSQAKIKIRAEKRNVTTSSDSLR